MKRSLLFFALLVMGFASCKKDDDNTIYSPSYHVDGITDLTLVKGSRTGAATPFLSLNVMYENATQERVSLSLENAPQGLYYKIFTTTGIPTFSSAISFADSGVAEGTYPLKLVARGEYSGRKEFRFNMEVTALPDCTADIIGSGYTTNSSCSSSPYMQAILTSGVRNRVFFSNIDNNGFQLYATVDCDAQSLLIPEQVVNGVTYQGWGGYSISGGQRLISLGIQSTSSSGTNFCNYSIVK